MTKVGNTILNSKTRFSSSEKKTLYVYAKQHFPNSSVFSGANLDTLAQPSPASDSNSCRDACCKTNDTLKKRAMAKATTNEILFPLIDLNSKFKDKYWNTYHCSKTLTEANGKITGKYCKNRWCIVCNRIRTAKLINGYSPVFKSWKQPQFVTLTMPTVEHGELADRIKLMTKQFQLIRKNCTEQKKMKLSGIRKLEVTYSKGKYHPHFHILMDGSEDAKLLVDMWLDRNPTANRDAQDIRPADHNSMIETFKYFTKLFKKEKYGTTLPYPPDAMDYIFQTLYKKRTVQSFGDVKIVDDNFKDSDLKATVEKESSGVVNFIEWEWEENEGNWVDRITGELLVDFDIKPPDPPPKK